MQSRQGNPREIVDELYLTILSRFPTRRGAEDRGGRTPSPAARKAREAVVDLAWALINSAEFLYRH